MPWKPQKDTSDTIIATVGICRECRESDHYYNSIKIYKPISSMKNRNLQRQTIFDKPVKFSLKIEGAARYSSLFYLPLFTCHLFHLLLLLVKRDKIKT